MPPQVRASRLVESPPFIPSAGATFALAGKIAAMEIQSLVTQPRKKGGAGRSADGSEESESEGDDGEAPAKRAK